MVSGRVVSGELERICHHSPVTTHHSTTHHSPSQNMNWLDLTTWTWAFFISEWVIRLGMLAVVPFRRTPAAAKGWLLLIFFEPWIGLILYFLIGRPPLPPWRMEQTARLPQAMAKVVERLTNHPNVFHPQLSGELALAGVLAEN